MIVEFVVELNNQCVEDRSCEEKRLVALREAGL